MNWKMNHLRWWIISLLFVATIINFLNRLAVSVLGPVIATQLHLSASQFALLTTAFLFSYTLSQGLSGFVFDRIGVKRGFTAAVSLWSVSSIAHGFAKGLASLAALRFCLGGGEGGTWPGAAKAIAEWFPSRERALAIGICNSGTAIGTAIATPLMIWLQAHYGWRTAFLVIGGLGFLWLLLWQISYHSPWEHPRITPDELSLLQKESDKHTGRLPFATTELICRRQTWGIVLSRFFGDPIWWLYITWLPLYLYNVRHFDMKQIAIFGWLPFLAADAGSLLGGLMPGLLMRSGWTVNQARHTVLIFATLLMATGFCIPFASSPYSALTCIGVVLFGYQAWIGNIQTLASDFFPQSSVGSVMGLGGFGAGLGAMLFTQTTGLVIDRWSYTPILIAAAILPVVATTTALLVCGPIRPLDRSEI